MTTDTPPKLRETIARDLRPTRPLRPPSMRALALLPLAVAIVLAIPWLHFFRSDMSAIGLVKAWGFSFGQALAGLVIVGIALRESIPGRGLSRGVAAATLGIGLTIPAAILLLTATRYDIGPGPGEALAEGANCFRVSAVSAIPALVAAAILAARAYPVRPVLAGALYGLGCGLMADAGLRLYCEFTVPGHVLLGHGGAILAVMAVGAVVAATVQRR
jgi:negative regulator of sigma F NrsF-like protein